jgi:hypothetical protein
VTALEPGINSTIVLPERFITVVEIGAAQPNAERPLEAFRKAVHGPPGTPAAQR